MSSTSEKIVADDSSTTVGRTAAGKRKEAEADADADVVARQTTQNPKTTSGQAVAAAQEAQTGEEGAGGDDSPGAGFWRAGFGGSILDAVGSAALYQLYAVVMGLLLAEVFVFHIVFRLSLSFVTRMVLMSVAQLYYPVLALSNSVVLTVLFATRRNLSRLEGALSSVADAVTAPLIRAMPASAVTGVSLDDLRERMLMSSRRVAQAEAPVTTNGWYGIRRLAQASSRVVLSIALRTVLYAVETRYKAELKAGQRVLSVGTVNRILRGELVSMLMAPFTSAISLYTALAFVETAVLTCAPFGLAYLLSYATPTPEPKLSLTPMV
jgi:hypothetical protein